MYIRWLLSVIKITFLCALIVVEGAKAESICDTKWDPLNEPEKYSYYKFSLNSAYHNKKYLDLLINVQNLMCLDKKWVLLQIISTDGNLIQTFLIVEPQNMLSAMCMRIKMRGKNVQLYDQFDCELSKEDENTFFNESIKDFIGSTPTIDGVIFYLTISDSHQLKRLAVNNLFILEDEMRVYEDREKHKPVWDIVSSIMSKFK